MSAKKMVTPLKQKTRTDLRTMQVMADHAQIDDDWSIYGYSGFRIMAMNKDGGVAGPTKYKAYWQKTEKVPEPSLRCMIPAVQPFIPMEAVEGVVYGLEKRLVDTFPELKKKNFKIESVVRKDSNKGMSQYWIVQTNQIDRVHNSHNKDDEFKLGFILKNGYNTGVALGVNVLTFRLICSNGAVAKGQDFATGIIRHVGKDPKKLLTLFQDKIVRAIESWADITRLYNEMAKIKLNEKMARYIYDNANTPDKFFPDYYHIATPQEKKANPKAPVIALTAQGKSVTLWENFNDMTQELWHSKDVHKEPNKKGDLVEKAGISFREVAFREMKLHNAIEGIVGNKEKFGV